MEVTAANAHRILAIADNGGLVSDLRTYLPQIFAKVRNPAQGDGMFVETYVRQLKQSFTRNLVSRQQRPGGGWNSLQKTCIESGIVDAYISLIQHPRDDYQPALFYAMDTLVDLAMLATIPQRRVLFDKAMECNSLKVLLDVMEHAELCLHRYSAMRFIRSLCADMFLGETLSATETAELLETFLQTANEGVDSFSTELRNPDKSWQACEMLNRTSIDPRTASKYGKRWFGIAQENLLFASQSLLCRFPVPSPQYILDVLRARPQIIDMLLDGANIERPDWYPETQVDQLASETLALIFQIPIRIIPGLSPPVTGAVKDARDADWKATTEIASILVSRPNWLAKILRIWKKLDDETLDKIKSQIAGVTRNYCGSPLSSSVVQDIYDYRGSTRISVLRLIEAATYATNVKDGELLSLLRVAYLATHASLSPTKDYPHDATSPTSPEFYACMERTHDVFRYPVCLAYSNSPRDPDRDAPSHIPAQGLGAPTALLRLLTVLGERGILGKAPSWTELPEGCAIGTSLPQVKQIMSEAVLKKLIPLVTKRSAASREIARRISPSELWRTRARYVEIAHLGATMLAFDRVMNGRWKDSIRGLKREVVVCLVNAADLSIRGRDFDAALGFALSADAVAQTAGGEESVGADFPAENKQRIQLAKQGLNQS